MIRNRRRPSTITKTKPTKDKSQWKNLRFDTSNQNDSSDSDFDNVSQNEDTHMTDDYKKEVTK